MASIVKRGKKYAVIYYEGEGKTRQQIWESGMSYTQAKARKAKIELDQSQNIHVERNDYIMRTFLTEFSEKYGVMKWGTSYFESNQRLFENYVYPYWGSTPISRITVKAVDDYYDHLLKECPPVANLGKPSRKRVSPSTIHDIHKVLRTAFNIAKKWQYIAQNPFLDATLPEYKSKERDALTAGELQKILDKTDNPEDYDLYLIHCAMILAFFCSLRGGEIGGIQWDDVYFDDGKIDICKAIDRVPKKLIDKLPKAQIFYRFPNLYPGTKTVIVLKNTKTEGSNRIANFQAIVAQKLLTLKQMQERLMLELGEDGYMDYGLVICQANGRPIMTEHLNKRFKMVLQQLGMKEVVFHSIRVTSTTVKLRLSGGDIKAVQGENGHKDPKMVTKQYSRIFEEDRLALTSKMQQAYDPQASNAKQQFLELIEQNPEMLAALLEQMSRISK